MTVSAGKRRRVDYRERKSLEPSFTNEALEYNEIQLMLWSRPSTRQASSADTSIVGAAEDGGEDADQCR